ncbi:unnamed protein product [Rotaria sp. Silwood1]|nr:unnamed protein product [Rotaria sp. Silwood1]
MNNIQFKNISDVRIIDSIIEIKPRIFSIQSKDILTTWCNIYGCLRVLGKVIFSIDCPLACQLRKLNKTKTLNLIQPSIKMNLNSTLNINYIIELDAFTISKKFYCIKRSVLMKRMSGEINLIQSLGQENGDQIKVFLLYSLIENRARTLSSSFSTTVDNLSLINITRLVRI